MKVLWLTNVKLPIIYKISGELNKTVVEGWHDQISEKISKNNKLIVCYPTDILNGEKGGYGNLSYYGIYFKGRKLRRGRLDEKKCIPALIKVLESERPDVIHIHGTEFQYAYYMTKAAEKTEMQGKVVISIQGLVKFYAEHYLFGLPKYIVYGKTVKELLLGEGVYSGYKSYILRGKAEEKALHNTKYVIGRTNWDKGCLNIINPHANYLFWNETLRADFYTGIWKFEKCVPHSIFLSQAFYPIKGLHLLLKALVTVKKRYHDIRVKIAGHDMSKDNWVKGSSYALYIQRLIRRYHLEENICFLGCQTAEQMKQELLKTNVFVSPSMIENSPNSLGEAMILGVPCISSDVGGVTSLMVHNKEGYLYPLNEIYMLAYYIMDIFADTEKASAMGMQARKHALKTHDVDRNFETIMKIYAEIEGKESK